MTTPLHFRPATLADRDALVALVTSAYRGDSSRAGWTTEADLLDGPHKLEAGTPNIAGFVGLGVACDYLSGIGMAKIAAREQALLAHATEEMRKIDGLRLYGTAPHKAAVISFAIDGTHSHDLATLLDLEGVAVRSGQHCAHPLLQWLGVGTTCRASLAFWNTHAEIDAFIVALRKVSSLLLA